MLFRFVSVFVRDIESRGAFAGRCLDPSIVQLMDRDIGRCRHTAADYDASGGSGGVEGGEELEELEDATAEGCLKQPSEVTSTYDGGRLTPFSRV